MAETPPPPTAGAESCSEEPARGGEWRPEELRRAPAGGTDREGEVGPPPASPAGQSEPDSPVAAPFFLLYPGDGGAGFGVRPPPQQQRSWRTPPSPGSPLPFLLLSYPSGGGGGGGSGKHREWRRGMGTPAGKGAFGWGGPSRPPRSSASGRVTRAGRPGGRGSRGGPREAVVPRRPVRRQRDDRDSAAGFYLRVSPGRDSCLAWSLSPLRLGAGLCRPPTCLGGGKKRPACPSPPGAPWPWRWPCPGSRAGNLPRRSRGGGGAGRPGGPSAPPSSGSRRRGS